MPLAPELGRAFDQGFDRGYDQGYQNGYRQGYDRGFEFGFQKADVANNTAVSWPANLPAPLGPVEVLGAIQDALAGPRGLAMIRVGDGEALVLAQEKVLPVEEVVRRGPFLSYAGVNVPDIQAREDLALALRQATIIGLPLSQHPNFQPLALQALAAHGVDPSRFKLTDSVINYRLFDSGCLTRLLKQDGLRLALAGNRATELGQFLREKGIEVGAVYAKVDGVREVGKVVADLGRLKFEVLLVAAGVAAKIICSRVAAETGRVALDIGHLAEQLLNGVRPWVEVGVDDERAR